MYICPELRLSPPAAAEPRLQLQKEIPFSASSPPAHPGNTGISPGFSSRRSSPTPTACSPSPDDLHTDTPAQRGAWGPLALQPFPLAHSAVLWKLPGSAGAWPTRNSAGSLPKPECHRDPPSSPPSAFLCQMQSTIKSWTGSSEISPELLPRLHPHCHLQASGSP